MSSAQPIESAVHANHTPSRPAGRGSPAGSASASVHQQVAREAEPQERR